MKEAIFTDLKDLYTFQESLIYFNSMSMFQICKNKNKWVLQYD